MGATGQTEKILGAIIVHTNIIQLVGIFTPYGCAHVLPQPSNLKMDVSFIAANAMCHIDIRD
jgi:hypothetical protein